MKKRTPQQTIGDMAEATVWAEPRNMARTRRNPSNYPGSDLYRVDLDQEIEVKGTRKRGRVDPSLTRREAEEKETVEARGGKYVKRVKHIPGANLGIRENLRDIHDGLRGKKRQ